jgi:hypothetical protein
VGLYAVACLSDATTAWLGRHVRARRPAQVRGLENMVRRVVVSWVLASLAALLVVALMVNRAGGNESPSSGPMGGSTVAPTSTTAALSTANPATSPGAISTPATIPSVALGAYIPGAPSQPSNIDVYAALTGRMPSIVMWYQKWAPPFNDFDVTGADAIRARGAMPLISWEPRATHQNFDPLWSLGSIVDGDHDAYIHRWTHEVAAWGYTVYVRPMHEMNGNWTSWSPGVNGNTAEEFVSAWRHIIDIARAEGATNIRWVWCPNVDDGNPNLTPYDRIYPGDSYVDWIGLVGYNWGTSQSWSTWQDLTAVFKGSIAKIDALTRKPLMIAEMGSAERGGDKATWITTGFGRLMADLPEVKALVWFNAFDARLQTDWRVESSTDSLAAFRKIAASKAFAGTLP